MYKGYSTLPLYLPWSPNKLRQYSYRIQGSPSRHIYKYVQCQYQMHFVDSTGSCLIRYYISLGK